MVVRRLWESPSADYFGGPSPDGRYLTYIDFDTGNLAVHDVVTGQQRLLTQQPRGSSGVAGYSAISPDGQQVAYGWVVREKSRRGELRLVGLDTREPRVLYQNEEVTWVHPNAWTPDGKQILALFRRKDRTLQIVLVSVADGSVRVLKSLGWNYPFNVDLSPDGRHIVGSIRVSQRHFGAFLGFAWVIRWESPCGSSWKTRSVFQGAVGAFCASTVPSASTGPVRVRQDDSQGGGGPPRPRTAVDR